MSDSDYLANKLNDHVCGKTTFTAPTTMYAQLYSSNPGPTNTGAQISIARAAYTNNVTNWPASSGRSKTNGTKISWGSTAGVTGFADATHVGFLDASSGGDLLFYGALNAAMQLDDRTEIAILPGQLTIAR